MKIKKEFDNSEPMHCQADGCNEELNGLNRYSITIEKIYTFEMWLCNKHSAKFDKVKNDYQ
jgi:hypothetical protein